MEPENVFIAWVEWKLRKALLLTIIKIFKTSKSVDISTALKVNSGNGSGGNGALLMLSPHFKPLCPFSVLRQMPPQLVFNSPTKISFIQANQFATYMESACLCFCISVSMKIRPTSIQFSSTDAIELCTASYNVMAVTIGLHCGYTGDGILERIGLLIL